MSTIYLIDGHTAPLASSEINDVLLPSGASVITNGNFVVKVPDGVKLSGDPTDLPDLLTKKYLGILAQYPGFTHIIYDDMLDPASITAISPATASAQLGYRGNIGYGKGASLKTAATDISPTVLTQCIVVAEYHRWSYTNPIDGRMDRVFEDVTDSVSLAVEVHVDGSLAATSYQNGELVSIPLANQGSSVELIFKSGSSDPTTYITSWALIY